MLKDRTKLFLVSGFGTGRIPIIPGTWASGLAVLLWLAAYWLLDGHLLWLTAVTLAAAAGAVAVCIAYSPLAVRVCNKEDPRLVTADELAGQWVAMLGVSWLGGPMLVLGAAFVRFVFFRIFDILKPWPCRRLERLPAGVGIAADDLMAGAYANLAGWIVQIVYLKILA